MTQPKQSNAEVSFWSRLPGLRWDKALIWLLFLVILYVFRELFFIVFMTFVFCFIIRSIVDSLQGFMAKPGSPTIDRALTASVFLGTLLTLGTVTYVVAPKVTREVKALAEKLQELTADEVELIALRSTVGNYLFRQKFGLPASAEYQQSLSAWQDGGRQGEGLYRSFPTLATRMRTEFEAQYDAARVFHLQHHGNDALGRQRFDDWFLSTQAPTRVAADRAYYAQRLAGKHLNESQRGGVDQDLPLRQLALEDLKSKPVELAAERAKWDNFTTQQAWSSFRQSKSYADDFRDYYQRRRAENPAAAPYDYELFAELKAAFQEGKQAFLGVVKSHTSEAGTTADHLAHDFEVAMKDELAQNWWSTSSLATTLREHVHQEGPALLEYVGNWASNSLSNLAGIPLQLVTALVLTIFITLDWHALREGIASIRSTRLRPIYDEIVPEVTTLGKLLGKSFRGQAIIALFNAAFTFAALLLIGVENKFMLSGLVFVFSFVPVVGVVFSGVPMIATAMMQPGGSPSMALQVVLAIVVLHLIEGTVLGPRIVGKLGHLHPLLVIVILTISEHFFGMWGLLLGVPVAIYVIRVVLLGEEIPGISVATPTSPSPHPVESKP